MDSSQIEDEQGAGRSALARVLLVAGALVGFTVLAVLLSGTANAAEKPSPGQPDRPGLLSAAEQPLRAVVKPVTDLVEPVLAPVTRPVVKVVAPVLSVVRPVTEPVLRPVLHAVAPVTAPVVHAVEPDPAVEAVAGKTATTPRDDVRPAPAQPGPAVTTGRSEVLLPTVTSERATSSAAHERQHPNVQADRGTAGWMSGPDGGGPTPPTPAAPAASGSMSAGSAGQHGGEYAVTGSGSSVPGTDRTRRAPPGGHASLYWLVFYGNDHPS
jgi:hypothetical protein